MQLRRDSALQAGAPCFSLPLLLLPGSRKEEVLIAVSRKQWGLNSSSQRSNTYTIPGAHGKIVIKEGRGEPSWGQQRAFPHTAGVGLTRVLLVSFWCAWIKSAGAGCVVKRERGLKMDNCFASRPFQYPPLLSAGSAAEC